MSGRESPYQAQVERLVRHLTEAERALQSMAGGEIDAIVDPATAAPILLSRAQDAIVRSEARYRDLIARSPSLVLELAADGTLLFANEAVRRVVGVRPAVLAGVNWWTTLVPPEMEAAAAALADQLRHGDVNGVELPLTAHDGTIHPIEWTSVNRYTGDGSLEAIVLFGLDVTERRRAEEAARRLSEAQVARAEAEAANRAKTEFLAVMSHELRTPLNAIAGYTEILELGLRGPVTQEQSEDLKKIRRSQRHLLGLINDLMNFARLEAGQVSFNIVDVPVRSLLTTIAALTEPQVLAKGVSYVVAQCEPHVAVRADRDKVQQILLNLVSNAIKFTGPGGRISVECAEVGDSVRISVRDTGQGIPEAKLESIFDPFVQVNKQFTREQEGVGLGLSISRDLAQGMRGEITVKSEIGVGSTFTLTLPSAGAPTNI